MNTATSYRKSATHGDITSPECRGARALLRKGSGLVVALAVALLLQASVAVAAPTYQTGKVNNVTFVGDAVFLRLDSGLPDNCAGTGSGWMQIPAANKPMQAWVTAMWLRGDMASVTVTIYTNGLVGGYCEISQIDPVE